MAHALSRKGIIQRFILSIPAGSSYPNGFAIKIQSIELTMASGNEINAERTGVTRTAPKTNTAKNIEPNRWFKPMYAAPSTIAALKKPIENHANCRLAYETIGHAAPDTNFFQVEPLRYSG